MKHKKSGKAAKEPKKIRTMDLILVIVGILLISFTITMIVIFKQTGMIPDTLCTCVFAALGGECGVMGWIKTSKERHRDRSWELEDRKNNTEPSENDGPVSDKGGENHEV